MSNQINFPYTDLKVVSLQDAVGKMPYTLTNDYLFRATLQQSNKALKGLICASLGLKPEEIQSVVILNPIELGKSIEAKDFILDIRVLLNDNTLINLELQVINYGNWPERSLGYLCRSYDHLNRGEDYRDTKQVIQISFLDFTLFKEKPEFVAEYMLMNVKNYMIYSDKLRLSVVDLTQIDLATEEDKLRGIDYWARLFKATTWEEIRMMAEKNEFLEEAAVTLRRLSAEEKIRMQCEAREDYYRLQRYINQKQIRLENEKMELQEVNATLEAETGQLRGANAALEEEKDKLRGVNAALEEEKDKLRGVNAALEEEKDKLRGANAALEEENIRLQEELSRLREKLAAQDNR